MTTTTDTYAASVLFALHACPSVDSMHVDVHGIRVELHDVVGFNFAGTILPLTEPEQVGDQHVARGMVGGLPVRVVAPVVSA